MQTWQKIFALVLVLGLLAAGCTATLPQAAQGRLMGCWMGGHDVEQARQIFKKSGIAD